MCPLEYVEPAFVAWVSEYSVVNVAAGAAVCSWSGAALRSVVGVRVTLRLSARRRPRLSAVLWSGYCLCLFWVSLLVSVCLRVTRLWKCVLLRPIVAVLSRILLTLVLGTTIVFDLLVRMQLFGTTLILLSIMGMPVRRGATSVLLVLIVLLV